MQRAGGALVTAFSTAAGNGNVGVVRQQATAIRSWATAEAAWLDVHPALYCFAAAYIIWDSLRGKADSVASEALAGNYDQSASDLNDMSDYSTRAVDAISQAAAHC